MYTMKLKAIIAVSAFTLVFSACSDLGLSSEDEDGANINDNDKESAFAVRCVKD